MKQTTALRKISSITKRIRGVQGGQGAAKTYSILMIIVNYCSGKSKKRAYVLSAELSKLRDTALKDCITIIESFGLNCQIIGENSGPAKIIFPNGSFIRFIGLDKEDVGKGLRSDVVYFNEANKISFMSYFHASTRSANVFIDFNPDEKFWFHDKVMRRNDCEFIKLTFLDNEFIPTEEKKEILNYHLMGYGIEWNPSIIEGTLPVVSKFWSNKWKVYGLGEIGVLDGAVFDNWDTIDDLPSEAKPIAGGLDFGFINPAAWIMGYKWNNQWIFDEIIYESKLSNEDLVDQIKEEDLHRHIHYADSAEPKSIDQIYKMGVNIHPCDAKVGLINYGIQVLNYDKFFFTKRSINCIEEAQKYIWDTDRHGKPTGKPRKKDDHAMNAIQYLVGTEGKYSGKY